MRLGLIGCTAGVAIPRSTRADEVPRPEGPERLALPVSSKAIDMVMGTTVIDMLGLLTVDWIKLFGWHDDPSRFTERDFRRLESSRIDIYHPAVETGAADARGGALQWIEGWGRLARAWPCFLRTIESPGQLRSGIDTGMGIVLGFQNSQHFVEVSDVAEFYDLGQRVSQLTYNTANRLGGGCLSPADRGLTRFGAEVVAEMNRLGMAIDLSHCGDRTTLDAMAASTRPVLITHSNCRALVPRQPRCKPDEAIRALAANDGVIGITAIPAFVRGRGQATLDDVLDHIEHVARLVGIEHVGMGSDVSSDVQDAQHLAIRRRYHVSGLEPELRAFRLADGMLRRGYAPRDIELVLGGNFRRVLTKIWTADPRDSIDERSSRRDPFCPASAQPPIADSEDPTLPREPLRPGGVRRSQP